MALPAGVPPASFRLEGGCLTYSATAANLKLVSAAGIAPAVPRFQAEHVAATPRAVDPGGLEPPGVWFLWRRFMWFLGTMTVGRLADPEGVAPPTLPQTTGRSAD